MTAVTTRLVRSGGYLIESAATGELIVEDTGRPSTYGHVVRDGLRVRWEITEGKYGRRLASGRTWTRGGAWALVWVGLPLAAICLTAFGAWQVAS